MINFRYHIVSLMAVFLALSIGIVLGVTFGAPVNQGLTAQAEQDRKQVQVLRAELDSRTVLDDYRDAWSMRAGTAVAAGTLTDRRVAVVTMPGAPASVVTAVSTAVTDGGGVLTSRARISETAFDTTKADALRATIEPFGPELELTDSMTDAERFGRVLGRALASKEPTVEDPQAELLRAALTGASLVDIKDEGVGQAQLIIVVTAAVTDPRPTAELLTAHVQTDAALKNYALGVVLAGPNSDAIEGTDVLAARNDAVAVESLSTVDVADLPSGVVTVVLAGEEQLLGRQGHYGALTKADAPLPTLPVTR